MERLEIAECRRSTRFHKTPANTLSSNPGGYFDSARVSRIDLEFRRVSDRAAAQTVVPMAISIASRDLLNTALMSP